MFDLSDHALTTIGTWTEVAILLLMAWSELRSKFGHSAVTSSPTSRMGMFLGIGVFIRQNRTIIIAVIGLGIVAWLNLRESSNTVSASDMASEQARNAVLQNQVVNLDRMYAASQQELENAKKQLQQQAADAVRAKDQEIANLRGQIITNPASVIGPSFVKFPVLRVSTQDANLIVVTGEADDLASDMDLAIDYRSMGLGDQPQPTPREVINSIGKLDKTRKGAPVEIPILRKENDAYFWVGDPSKAYLPRGGSGITYVRLAIIGPDNEEEHIYFQIMTFDDKPPVFLLPALSMNWIAAWEQNSK